MKTELELVSLLEKYKEELGKYRICYVKLAKAALSAMDIYCQFDESSPIFIDKYHEFCILSSSFQSNDKLKTLFIGDDSSMLRALANNCHNIFHISSELDQKTGELVWISSVSIFGKSIYKESKK